MGEVIRLTSGEIEEGWGFLRRCVQFVHGRVRLRLYVLSRRWGCVFLVWFGGLVQGFVGWSVRLVGFASRKSWCRRRR